MAALLATGAAQAVSVSTASPSGEVAQATQLRLQFTEAVVPLGDLRQADPAELRCEGAVEAKGSGRWASEREWLFELNQPLPAGAACRIALKPDFKSGPDWSGPREFRFQLGAPQLLDSRPWNGDRIEEDQQFLLRVSGAPDPASLPGRIWCEAEGIGERIPAQVQSAAARDAALKTQRLYGAQARQGEWLLLACQRPLPSGAKIRIIWGRGIAAALNPAVQTRAEQRLQYEVRKPLIADFSCQRERADAPCMPILPMTLSFSEPVNRALALKARLKPAGGGAEIAALAPKDEESRDELQRLSFPTPLPDNTSFQLILPAGLKDASGRPLSNASMFPLTVRTGVAPPIAKFAAGTFGIIEREAEGPALVPLTLRHVQGDLRPGAPGGQLLMQRFDSSDAELLKAYARIRKLDQREYESRKAPMLEAKSARRLDLPKLQGGDPRPFEVIGVPVAEPGFHVLELRSQRLGDSLLEPAAPMYVRTSVLVTNLGLHFKLGRESSLAWVTTLDRAQPVPNADIAVMDCHGTPVWRGRSDAQGLARIAQSLPHRGWDNQCPADQGLFVTARAGGELAFLFTSWQRGIESWRFNVPTAFWGEDRVRAHSVLDRPLLRAGETVSMKHFFRLETGQGLALAKPEQLPTRLRITHEGSGEEYEQPLSWQGQGRFAASQWQIPPAAKLGTYRIELRGSGDHSWVSGGFRVEEFRVPLVDARLNPPAQLPAAPKEIKLGAQLNFMAGGPMARAPLKLSALLRPREGGFAGYEDFTFEPPRSERRMDDEGDEPDASQREAKLVVDKQTAVTDAQGAAQLTIAKLPSIQRPSELLVELGYSDPNGEQQTVSRRLPLWPARVITGLRATSWVGNGDQLRFQALALNLDGKPLAGQKIVVRARQQQWLSSRKRMVGGFYAYDNKLELKELGELCSGSTDAQGRLSCETKLTTPGQVELIARAQDAEGHASEAASSIWVTRQGELWFAQDNDDRIDLIPEKKRYEPGETARLQVRMPFREATALVAIEREGIVETKLMTLRGRDPVIELPVARDWSPNVYVSVLALRGRIRDVPWYSFFTWGWRSPAQWWRDWRASGDYQPPTAMVDLGKPAHKLGIAAFEVGLARHALKVEVISDQPQYGVRQVVKARIKVTQDGKPVPEAELAFAAVDEGLLALRDNSSWDLLPAMLRNRSLSVETSTAQGEIVGRRHYGRKAIAAGGGGGKSARELFDTLLLWKPQIRLDAKGEAQIEVPLNDSLTSFRLVAVADAGSQRFGSGHAVVRVSQDLQMLSGLPPLVREGDKLQAQITVRNASSREMKLKVALKGTANSNAANGEIARSPLNLPTQEMSLAAGAARELSWPVEVPAGAFSIAWEGEAVEQGGAAKDRIKLSQLVQTAVPVRVLQNTLQQLDAPLSIPVAAPADALASNGIKRGGLQIGLQPRLSGALPGLRRYFETYPYTCLEQQSSKALALHDDAAWQALMAKLPTYLDSDGLANYFPPDASREPHGSDRLTAHLLAVAHESGRPLPEASRQRMLDGLAGFVEGRIQRRFWSPRVDEDARRIAALEALARYGRAKPALLATVDAGRINSWSTATLIDWLNLVRRLPDLAQREAKVAEAQAQLRSRINYAGSTLRFVNEDGDAWWWLMESPDANASRLILAVLDDPAWKTELPRLVQGNLARQQRGAWSTTVANLWGVLALEKFSARFESAKTTGRSLAALGSQQRAFDWNKQPDGGSLMLAWPEQAAPLQLKQEGTGKPWLTIQSLAAIPVTAPLNAGYRITRSVQAVEQKTKGSWSRGDLMRVRLEIEAAADMSWVVVNDPVPAGASHLGTGSGRDSAMATQGEKREGSGWLAYEERAFEAWRAYYAYLPRGRHVVEYTIRLNSAGRFQLPVTRVEALYAPDRFGEFPNAALEVAP
ncbi:MG2 domain-containing protein [Pelomonas sp. SE-A7]|uniref:alpha-2-macroglobulin family protein n=1 Tax=Pelomonas sp. SE-A7 TaxID=3054953 RepID=UPI00259D2779|nr:MG2 domain-containing protein [Pelomonas sp. SE-A7]MDM4766874.1 MG2 domain-containing protein [Pelomonas sp. SE-A7]